MSQNKKRIPACPNQKSKPLYIFCSLSLSVCSRYDAMDLCLLSLLSQCWEVFAISCRSSCFKKVKPRTYIWNLKFETLHTVCWAFLCSITQPSSWCSFTSFFETYRNRPNVLWSSLPPKSKVLDWMFGLQLKTAIYLSFLSAAQNDNEDHHGSAVSLSHIWIHLVPEITSLAAKSGIPLR